MVKYIIIIILYNILKIKSNNTFSKKITNSTNLKRNLFINKKEKKNYRKKENNFLLNSQINSKLRIINEKKQSSIMKIQNNTFDNIKNSTVRLKKNLVIGAIVNYKWEVISPFFKSFEKVGFENCDCIMFVGRMSQETINKIKSCGVKVLPIPNKFTSLNVLINNYRWKIYEDFLNDNQNKYNLIFTADVRDSFFQSNIFNKYEKSKPFLGIAFENNILTQIINKNWLIKFYGLDLYESIKNEKIICSGTVWGTEDKFREFSKLMWEEIKSKVSKNIKVTDQAVINYIIYHKKIFNDCIIKSEAKEGPVMTMGLINNTDIILDSKNNIINKKNEIISVIHQYDRKKDIVRKVRNKYCNEDKNLNKSKIILKKNNNIDIKNKEDNLNNLIIFFSVSIFLIFTILNFCNNCLNKKNFKNIKKNKSWEKVVLNYKEVNNFKNLERSPFKIIKNIIK
jgi:hypothetical protein